MLIWVLDVLATRPPRVADVLFTGGDLKIATLAPPEGAVRVLPLAELVQIDHENSDLTLHFVRGSNEIELVALRCVDAHCAESLRNQCTSSYRRATGQAFNPARITNLPIPRDPVQL